MSEGVLKRERMRGQSLRGQCREEKKFKKNFSHWQLLPLQQLTFSRAALLS
jgi:hypothetical protein